MLNIIKKEVVIDETLKKKIEIICDFCTTKSEIINGSIGNVDKTNEEYKNIQTLSYALTSADQELKEHREQIKKLTYSNDALNLRIETLNKNLEKEKEEKEELRNENSMLKQMVIHWKNKFNDIINFINNKIFKKNDREKYMDVATDLYENDLIEYKTYDSIREDYYYSIKKDKKRDDFEIRL